MASSACVNQVIRDRTVKSRLTNALLIPAITMALVRISSMGSSAHVRPGTPADSARPILTSATPTRVKIMPLVTMVSGTSHVRVLPDIWGVHAKAMSMSVIATLAITVGHASIGSMGLTVIALMDLLVHYVKAMYKSVS